MLCACEAIKKSASAQSSVWIIAERCSGFGSTANTHVYGSGNDYENAADMDAEEKAASRTFLWAAIAVLVLIFIGYRVVG